MPGPGMAIWSGSSVCSANARAASLGGGRAPPGRDQRRHLGEGPQRPGAWVADVADRCSRTASASRGRPE